MITWMVTSVLAAGMLGLAAHLCEGALRSRGRQSRWAWVVSIGASVALSLRALFLAAPATDAQGALAGRGVSQALLFELAGSGLGASAGVERVEALIPALWAALSLVFLVALVGGLARLRIRASRWPEHTVGGIPVLLSNDFGPAVLGLYSGRVVLPRWALGLSPERLRMVLIHEEEHRRTRDPAALIGTTLAVAALPWNPALWWQLARFRAAVEVDCDQRVVRRGVRMPEYGRLLLDLGSRPRSVPAVMAAFSRKTSLLERRLVTMTKRPESPRWGRTFTTLAGMAALVVVACDTPSPVGIELEAESTTATLSVEPAAATPSPDATGKYSFEEPVGGIARARERSDRSARTDEPEVFVDGRAIPRSDLSALDPSSIERVEITKGPGRGAINIYLKDGATP